MLVSLTAVCRKRAARRLEGVSPLPLLFRRGAAVEDAFAREEEEIPSESSDASVGGGSAETDASASASVRAAAGGGGDWAGGEG